MANKVIRIQISMEPVPKGRPRTTVQGGRVWTFTPAKTKKAQDFIRERLERHQDKCFGAHIPVMLTAVFYRTKSKYLTRRETMPVRKPDLDNFNKLLLDSINGILVADDAQITTCHLRKRWTDKPYPYITIRLEEDSLLIGR